MPPGAPGWHGLPGEQDTHHFPQKSSPLSVAPWGGLSALPGAAGGIWEWSPPSDRQGQVRWALRRQTGGRGMGGAEAPWEAVDAAGLASVSPGFYTAGAIVGSKA